MRIDLLNWLFVGTVLIVIVWRGAVAARVVRDERRRGFEPSEMIRWALVAVVAADRYW